MEDTGKHQWAFDESWIIEMEPGLDGNARVMVRFEGSALCDEELMVLWRFSVEDGMAVGRPHPGWEYRKLRGPDAVGVSVNPFPAKYAYALDKMELYFQLTRLVTLNRGGKPAVGTCDGELAALSDPVVLEADAHVRSVVAWEHVRAEERDLPN